MRLFVFHAEGLQSLSSQRVNLCINPEVVEAMEPEVEMWEGCLSFPGVNLYVKRPHKIKARWTNENGKTVTEELFGYDARCFLHELDHLNGITFDEYVSPKEFKEAQAKAEAQ
jgi:peptide deformylase